MVGIECESAPSGHESAQCCQVDFLPGLSYSIAGLTGMVPSLLRDASMSEYGKGHVCL